MNPMLIGALLGAGVGALQYPGKKKAAQEQRAINAEMMRQSPWTGMKPDQMYTQDPTLLGEIVPASLSGASFGASDAFKETPQSAYNPADFGSVESGYKGPSTGSPDLPSIPSMNGLQEGPMPLPQAQANLVAPGGENSLYAQNKKSMAGKISPWQLMQLQQMAG